MKKVLIIGSKGMLGQELVRVFSAQGGPASGGSQYEVVAWDRDEIDITDEAQVKEKIGALAPAIIINAAAYNTVDKCEEATEFELAKKLNGLAPGYLARVAKEIKIPPNPPFTKWGKGAIFVHYSSDYVFDGQKEAGYKENDSPSPISNYGFSKLMGEQAVGKIGRKYYIIRLQKLFGRPAQSVSAKKSFFETMLELARTRSELEIVDEELANFTYAPDLAERTKCLIEQNMPSGIFHITNEGAPVTWFGAAKILFKMAKDCHSRENGNPGPGRSGGASKPGMTDWDDIKLIPVPGAKFPRSAKRPKYSILLNTKLPPLRPWPEALKEFLGK